MSNLPNWLILVLEWGGLVLAGLMAALLISDYFLAEAPEAGVTPEPDGVSIWPYWVCAVKRRRFSVGARPTRQALQPEAAGAAMEVTK
jgi:hypothetical protein